MTYLSIKILPDINNLHSTIFNLNLLRTDNGLSQYNIISAIITNNSISNINSYRLKKNAVFILQISLINNLDSMLDMYIIPYYRPCLDDSDVKKLKPN